MARLSRVLALLLLAAAAGPLAASPTVPLTGTALARQGGFSTGCAFVGARLYCWGGNLSGQLGLGAPSLSSLAEWVRRPDTAGGDFVAPTSIAVEDRACVADAAGAWCWGRNERGQLGSGDRLPRLAPNRVPGLPPAIVELAQGRYHACARSAADGLWCWGGNSFGETGQPPGPVVFDPLLNAELAPPQLDAQRVPVLPSALASVALGDHHGCALAGGRVWCWGANDSGQLGDGSAAHQSAPVAVATLPAGIIAIAASPHHNCALAGDGGLWCWGNNYAGQVGVAPSATRPTEALPVRVAGLPGPASGLALAFAQSCALVGEQRWCWGIGDSGIPIGAQPALQARPALAPPDWLSGCFESLGALRCPARQTRHPYTQIDARELEGPLHGSVLQLAIGRDFACARTDAADGVQCWGSNQYGQLGNRALTPVGTFPNQVPLASRARSIAAGASHACAATDDGLWCWGDNRQGALGDGSTSDPELPVRARFAGTLLAAGDGHSCAWAEPGGLRCWGRDDHGQVSGLAHAQALPEGAAPLGDARVLELALGTHHSCATIEAAGGLRETRCWGLLPITQADLDQGIVDARPRVIAPGAALPGEAYPRLRARGFAACLGDRCYGLSYLPPDRGSWRVDAVLGLPEGSTGEFRLGGRLACAGGPGLRMRCAALTNRACAFEQRAGLIQTPGQGIACQFSESQLSPLERGWLDVVGLPFAPQQLEVGEQFACAARGSGVRCWGPQAPADGLAPAYAPVYRGGAVEPAPAVPLALDPARACPAYAVASVSLLDPAADADAGSWGLELLLADGRRYLNGGLNFGGFGTAAGAGVPGYAAFSIQNPLGSAQRVTLDLSGDGGEFVLTVESTRPPSTVRTEVLRDTVTLGGVPLRRSLTLADGFHIVGLQPVSGTRLFLAAIGTTQPDGGPAAFQGGAVVGGYLLGTRSGFAGVCTDDANAIQLRTQARSFRGTDGAGDLRLQVFEGQAGTLLYDSAD